jgi:membrane protein implicated in regulation of membrane protease activity
MPGSSPMTRRSAWLMVIFSLLDEAVVLVLVVLGLWYFHVKISWPLGLVVGLLMVAFVFIVHKAIIPSLLRRKLTGREGMIGLSGRVTEPLSPGGTVTIKGEYWKARCNGDCIAVGEDVEVVGIDGLTLEVKKKTP